METIETNITLLGVVQSSRESADVLREVANCTDMLGNVKRINYMQYRIECIDGSLLYAIPQHHYSRWCKGKTYMFNDTLYHSGHPVGDRKETDEC